MRRPGGVATGRRRPVARTRSARRGERAAAGVADDARREGTGEGLRARLLVAPPRAPARLRRPRPGRGSRPPRRPAARLTPGVRGRLVDDEPVVGLLESVWRAVAELCRDLDAAAWARPTD